MTKISNNIYSKKKHTICNRGTSSVCVCVCVSFVTIPCRRRLRFPKQMLRQGCGAAVLLRAAHNKKGKSYINLSFFHTGAKRVRGLWVRVRVRVRSVGEVGVATDPSFSRSVRHCLPLGTSHMAERAPNEWRSRLFKLLLHLFLRCSVTP